MSSLIRGSVLANFAELVSSLGGDADQLLRARGVDPAAPGDFDRFVSSAAAAAVVADAAELLNCPDFGMRLARKQGIQILGPVAVIIRNAETFASALEGVSRYLHNVAPPDHVELVRGPQVAVLTLTTTVHPAAHRDQWVEKGLGLAMDAFRLMVGEDFVPLGVTMQHRRIGPLQNYKDMFHCPVEFGSELNSLHLPNHALAQPIRDRDAAALSLAEKYLTDIGPDLEVADRVRDLTQRLLVVNHASLVQVARAMSLHPRILQRRLAESGTTFEEILDNLRKELTWELSATSLQISEIATMLGYTEQSSYTRACRRWFGESPRHLRARRRGQIHDGSA